MLLRFPKDDASMRWTAHVKNKMVQYGLGEGRIRRVIKNGTRREEGVAPNTVAVMQRNDTPKRKEEIWVMVQESRNQENNKTIKQGNTKLEALRISLRRTKMTIISAWRYPGVSKPGKAIPIPDDVMEELDRMIAEGEAIKQKIKKE
ncbi:MAG: hypothetical protein HYZ07_01325 [Candidatus Harrisonbacteria bacterium]|nr:hypothetical protein [Candidatus Harrisonbacteria bacterium]